MAERNQNFDVVIEKHAQEVAAWMREENINPESNFGKEFLKQSKLLFDHEEKIRELMEKMTTK